MFLDGPLPDTVVEITGLRGSGKGFEWWTRKNGAGSRGENTPANNNDLRGNFGPIFTEL